MEFRDEAFDGGVESAFGMVANAYLESERARETFRALMADPKSNCVERAAASKAAEAPPVLWQRIVGFDPTVAYFFEPRERRAGLKKLIRAVERMYRAELRNRGAARSPAASAAGESGVDSQNEPVVDAIAPGVSRIGEFVEVPPTLEDVIEREGKEFQDGTRSFAEQSKLFDPLPEICAYLGIAQRKLSELCRQQTGLRIHEVGDCIRVEKLREHLRETFRKLAREWKNGLSEKDEERLRGRGRESAWKFLNWMRGCGRGESRKKLAWEIGVPTPARLGRAAYVCLGETLEEIELRAAMAVLAEFEMQSCESNREHGACLSDVPPWEEKSPFEENCDEEEEDDGRTKGE